MFGSLGQYFLLLVSVLLWGVFKTEPQTYLKPSMEGFDTVLVSVVLHGLWVCCPVGKTPLPVLLVSLLTFPM